MKISVRIPGAFLFVIFLLNGCVNNIKLSEGGAEMALTPITEKSTGEYYPGKFVWHDLVTADIKLAGKFYEKLFGWKIEYQDKYAVVRNGNKLIAGIMQIESSGENNRDGVWLPSVSVSNIDSVVRLVKANGGKILKGPINMKLRGEAVLISDPQRADLVLLKAKEGDPVDEESAIGDWLWDELWSKEPEKIQAFYQAVLGYDEINSGDGYDILKTKGKWRAGIRHIADDVRHLLWVPVVRVQDPDAMVQRVSELGGVVWVSPDEAPGKADIALIGDPTGALFLIQRWSAQSVVERL